MTGIIWLVQILIYPSFSQLNGVSLGLAHQFHTRRITWVVAPLMGLEALSGAVLYLARPNHENLFNMIAILFLWAYTALVSVPIHSRIERKLSGSIDWLVWSNWPRTIVWTLRSFYWISFLVADGHGALLPH